MKRKNIYLISSLVFFCLLTFIISNNVISKNDYLYSIDPYLHLRLSNDTLKTGLIENKINSCKDEFYSEYPSILRSLIPIYSIITKIELKGIFEYGGAILTLFLFISIFIFLRRFLKRNLPIYLALCFSATYLIWRSFITYPESLALPLLVWIIFSIFIFNPFLTLIFLLSYFYTHPPSFFIPLFFIFIFYYYNIKKNRFKETIIYLLIIFISSIPLLKTFLYKTKNYLTLHSNIIDNYINIKNYEIDLSRYSILTYQDYLYYVGIPIILFGTLGLIILLSNKNNLKVFSIFTIFVFLLSTGFFKFFYFPYYRILSFLTIYLIILSCFYLEKFSNKKFLILLLSLFIILGTLNSLNLYGSKDITKEDFEAISKIDNVQGIVISSSYALKSFMNGNLECDEVKTKDILNSNNVDDFYMKIKEYPSPIYFYILKKDISKINYELFSNEEIFFENDKIIIYYVK